MRSATPRRSTAPRAPPRSRWMLSKQPHLRGSRGGAPLAARQKLVAPEPAPPTQARGSTAMHDAKKLDALEAASLGQKQRRDQYHLQ